MPDPVTPLERLPCGCRHGLVGEAFVFEPCALDCEFYLYVLAESERQAKPVRTIDAR